MEMNRFDNLKEARRNAIAAVPANPLPTTYNTNEKAKIIHPVNQHVTVTNIQSNGPDAKTIELSSVDGRPLAPFRAGQYISIALEIGNTKTTRAYSLSSSPAWAKKGVYQITVKRVSHDSFANRHILDTWQIGTQVTISGPQGYLYYTRLRDAKKVLALAGGAGITPFLSMARAICDGYEDFDLTILYGSRSSDVIIAKDELDKLAASSDKIHVVHVLSDEKKPGCEHGFITADLIRKYTGDGKYSLFLCGPQAMYHFLDGEIAALGLEKKYVRRECFGMDKEPWKQAGWPLADAEGQFQVKVIIWGKEYHITAFAKEPLLVAFERAGIAAPSRCRSGECGWCRSRLLSGDVFIPEATDGRREADKYLGYIHPCSCYPVSDLVVEVPGEGIDR